MTDYISQSLDLASMQSSIMPSSLVAQNMVQNQTDNQSFMDKSRKAAEDFEAVFLTQMVEQMFENAGTGGFFGGGQGEKVFRSMLAQEYGKSMAANGGIGIADDVQKEMLRMQEAMQ